MIGVCKEFEDDKRRGSCHLWGPLQKPRSSVFDSYPTGATRFILEFLTHPND